MKIRDRLKKFYEDHIKSWKIPFGDLPDFVQEEFWKINESITLGPALESSLKDGWFIRGYLGAGDVFVPTYQYIFVYHEGRLLYSLDGGYMFEN